MIEVIKRYEKRISDLQFILSVVFLDLLINIVMSHLINILESYFGSAGGLEVKSIPWIIVACLIGPFLESLFVAWLVGMFQRKFKLKKGTVLLITTTIFALLHYYSVIYIIAIFPSLFLQVYSYMYYEGKKLSSFNIMFIIHMLENSIAVIAQFIC